MRKLYGSNKSWRRILSLTLAIAMILSVMGTSGYTVFAEDLTTAAEEEVITAKPEAIEEAAESAEEAEAAVEEPGEAVSDSEEPAEPVEETEEGELPEEVLTEDSEPAEEAAEEAEPVEAPAEEPAAEVLPVEDETLIAEAAKVIIEDDGSEAPAEIAEEPAPAEPAAEPVEAPVAEEPAPAEEIIAKPVEAVEPVPGSAVAEMTKVVDAPAAAAEPAAVEEQPAEEALPEGEVLPEEVVVEEPVIAMPAAHFHDIIGGISVTVDAPEGAFPEGTTMKLAEVEIDTIMDAVSAAVEGEVVKAKAVDITFVFDGEEIQPELPIAVKMNASGMNADSDRQVLHIEESGEATVLEDADTSKKAVEFEADKFSVYVVVETGADARLEVVFMNGETQIASMFVKKSDTTDQTEFEKILYDPGIGEEVEDAIFKGWTLDSDYTATSTGITIDGVRSAVSTKLNSAAGVTDGEQLVYYAVLLKAYNVSYWDERGVIITTEDVLFRADSTEGASYTFTMGYTPLVPELWKFEGWAEADPETGSFISSPPEVVYNTETITLHDNLTVRAYCTNGNWISFVENGGTYTAPEFVKTGENTKGTAFNGNAEKADPTRFGYTFAGWFTDKEATIPFTFGSTISDNISLYAGWTVNSTANYSVLIWKQNVSGTGYDFEEAITLNGNSNETISSVTATGSGNNRYARVDGVNKQYTGFYLESYDTGVTIDPNGTSVVNIYYNRITYTLTFQDHPYNVTTSNNGTQYGLVDNQYVRIYRINNQWRLTNTYNGTVYNGTRYTQGSGWTTVKTIEGLYQQNISENFPIHGTNGAIYDNGERWDPQSSTPYSEVLVFIDVMPSANVTFHLDVADRDTKYIHYMVEALPGETGDREYNGKQFVIYNEISANYTFFTEAEDYVDLVGFSKNNNYPPVAYGANGNQLNSVWNNDNAVDVYCYYLRDSYEITYMDGIYVNGNGVEIKNNKTNLLHESDPIPYGADISECSYDRYNNVEGEDAYIPQKGTPAGFDPEGYVFAGWFADSEGNTAFDFDTMTQGGIIVYAKWVQIQYRVFLHPNAGTAAGGDKDESLVYGDENQATCFRIDYGGQISDGQAIHAERDNYELVSWYTDEACNNVFTFASFIANDSTAHTTYDKTRSTETDQWGETGYGEYPNLNKDAQNNRFWITYSIDLYAKWRSKLAGANGINIAYDAGEGDGAPTDEKFYTDESSAIAGPAPTTAPEGKIFSHWVVQKYENSAFVDTDVTVLPGESFIVLVSNAMVEDIPETQEGINKKYTVRLIAVYVDIEEATPTHIDWYANNGTTDVVSVTEVDGVPLSINQAIAIQPATTFTYAHHTFIGWAKSADATEAWLKWDGEKFTCDGITTDVTRVAADENLPYDDLYAVWEEDEVTINYAVASDSTGLGTVSLAEETVKAVTGTPAGSTATATSNTYVLDYWSCDEGTESISTSAKFVPEKEDGAYAAHTYYAHFKLGVADVTVEHYLFGEPTPFKTATIEEQSIGSTYTATPETTYQEKNLTVNSYDPTQAITVKAEGNIIKIYYTLPLTITAKTDGKTYDGQPLNGSYTISGQLSTDTEVIKSALGTAPSIKNVGSVDYLTEEEQAAITGIPGYYDVSYTAGKLTINPAPVTITTGSGSKAYDGSALTNATASITGLVNNETATVTATGTITEVGNTPNTYSIDWGTTNKDNYTITEQLGTLTITENSAAVTLTAASDSKTYDGTALTNATVTASGLPEGFTVEATASGSQTNAGESANVVNDGYVIKDASGADKTASFTNVTKVDGKLTVNKAPVTITTGSDSKAYDGTPLTKAEAAITGLVNNETATVTATGSQTEVGSSSNTYSIEWGQTNKDNYIITENLGTLTITASSAEVVLTAASDSKTYDGTALTNATVTASGLPEGFTYEASAEGSAIDVANSGAVNIVKTGYKFFDAAGNDKTANFTNVKTVNGTLTINPAPVTITTGSGSKAYDGAALTVEEATITGLVNNETATVTATGSQTEVGSSKNSYSIVWGNTKSANYTVTENLGTLTVTATSETVTLTAASDSKTYDGSALTNAAVTASGLPEGFTVEATASGRQLIVGESANVVNDGYVIKDASGEDKTANFTDVQKVDGKLTVNPAPVTITTGSDNKAYDGTALTNAEASIEGLVNGETATVTATGSQTEVGSSDNTYSIDWGQTNKDNYTVTEELGTLEVTVNKTTEIKLIAASDSKTYDGTALTNSGVTAEGLPEGFTVEATASGSQTDAGESANVVNDGYVIKDASGADKTANFATVEKVDGKLTVNKAAATITTGSGSKAYDGSALTVAEASIEGLVNNETATVTATGSQTEVGSSENTYRIAWGTAKEANYTITEKLGTLTVTENSAAVTLTAASDSKTYDGTALTNAGVTASGLPEGFTVEATASGSQTDAGESANVVNDGYKIKDASGADKTASFTNVTKVDGKLTVNKAAVTITTGSGSKAYDGSALTVAEASIEGLVNNETATVTATGSQTEVGSSDNTYSIDWGRTNKDNYTVTEELGTLEVTTNSTAAIKLIAATDSKTYDGTALTNSEVTAEGLPQGFTVEATASGSQLNVGESANVVNDGYKIKDASGADKTANFTNVEKVDGKLTVSAAALKITADSDSKVYDGTALTKNSYTSEGLAKSDSIESVSVVGSQTLVGSSANVASDAKIVNAEGKDATGNYKIEYVDGTLTVTDGTNPDNPDDPDNPVDPDLVVTKEVAATAGTTAVNTYKLGDTVTFNITATNIYNKPQTITLEEIDGVTLAQSSFNAAAGETIETTATYTITEADIQEGSFTNTVTAKVGNLTKTAEATVENIDEAKEHLTIEKVTTSTPANGKTYALGETISYKITATNDGNITLEGIVVVDELTKNEWPVDVLAPGASKEFTTTYTVTEADILAGEVLNVATVKDTDPDDPGVTPGVDPEPTDDPKEHLTIEKVSTSTPANGKTYALGETISYKITVTNDGNVTMKDFVVTDELTGDEWRVESLAPNASKEYTTTYKVTEADILAGEVLNVATAKSNDPDDPEIPVTPGRDPEPTEGLDTTLSVKKEITNAPADGKAFKLGETIKYTITVKNEGNAVYKNVVVEDELVNLKETIAELKVGETKTYDVEYVVKEADILAGEVANTATAKADPIPDPKDPNNPKTPEGEDTITTGSDPDPDDPDNPPTPPIEDKNGHLTIEKETTSETPKTGYALGDEISYKITVKNDGNLTITDITVEDELTEDEWTIESLAPGASKEFTATYTVTEDDILAGEVVNVATAKGTSPDPDKPDVPVTPGEDPEPTEGLDTTLSVKKEITNAPADGKAFKLGETIKYTITVKNEGNAVYKNVVVEDELVNLKETIAELKVGETKTYDVEYVVKEADILAGEVANTATAKADPIPDPKDPNNPKTPEGEDTITTGSDPDPDDPDDPPTPPIEDKKGHLTIEKETTSETPEAGYALGDEISYKITVKNDGNLTITAITVTDELTEDEWTIESLAPGASKEFTATYTVTEADILKGEVLNVATAKGTSPDPQNPDVPVTPGEDPEPTEDLDTTMSVKKTIANQPANGKAFVVGETIKYTITVTNDGNVAYNNVVVKDELVKLEETIEVLAVGETKTYNVEYVVTEDDIVAGKVTNTVTAAGDPIDDPKNPDEPKKPEGEDTITTGDEPEDPDDPPTPPIEDKDGHLTITKETTSKPADGKAYVLGEEVKYEIKVENVGNVTIRNIEVKDELTNDTWTIQSLAPKASETFEATHTVTEDDILAGKVVNVATATGTQPGGGDPTIDPGTKEDPTEEKKGHLTIEKVTTSETPEIGYALGDTITYKITATNDGNLTLTNVTVSDELTGDEWTIQSLAPKASEEFTASYTVTEKDVEAGEVVNVATAKGTSPDPDKPDVPVTPGEDPEPVADHYTVIYNDGIGNELAKFENIVKGKATPTIENPTRSGYEFARWNPAVAETVTEDATYTAQWTKIGGGSDPDPTPGPGPIDEPDDPTPDPEPDPEPIDDPDEPVVEPEDPNANIVVEPEEDPTEVPDNPVPFAPAPFRPAPAPAGEPAEEIDDAEVPEQNFQPNETEVAEVPTIIDEPEVPLAAGGAWALVNLILAGLSTVLAIFALTAKKDEEEDEDEQTRAYKASTEEEEEEKAKKHRLAKLGATAVAIASIATFLLTEDMTQKMIMVDKWTLLMGIYAIGDGLFTYKARKGKDEEEEDEQANA